MKGTFGDRGHHHTPQGEFDAFYLVVFLGGAAVLVLATLVKVLIWG